MKLINARCTVVGQMSTGLCVFLSDLDRPVPKQAMTAWAGIHADYNNQVAHLACDATTTVAFRADALAVSAVSAATGCRRNSLMQAALGSQQRILGSAPVWESSPDSALHCSHASRCIECRCLCNQHCISRRIPYIRQLSATYVQIVTMHMQVTTRQCQQC